MLPINWNPGATELRSFARCGFRCSWRRSAACCGGGFNLPDAALSVWGIGALVAVAVLADGASPRAVFVGLMVVTYPIGLVVSTVALALLFFLLFARLGGACGWPAAIRSGCARAGEPTEWQPVKQDLDAQRMFRQF